MKVTVIGPVYPYRGGIAHYTTRLTRALLEKHSVQVISFRRQYPAWLYPGQTDKDPSLQPVMVKAEYILDPLYPWTWLQAARRIIQYQPGIVVGQWWTPFWAPALAGLAYLIRRNRLPLLFLIHNVFPHEGHFFDRWLARLALGQGSAMITGTTQEQKRLLAILPSAAVEVYPHPIYDLFPAQRIPQEQARRKLGLPEARRVVLSFGIVRPYKGLKYLIEALAMLRDQGVSLGLLVAGEFWESKIPYVQQIERLGLGEQVSIIDRYITNEEMPFIFGAADLFAAPYTGGTQSGSLKAAMGYGIPVVASQNIVDEEMATMEGKGVYIAPPGNAHALAEAISRALEWNPVESGKTRESGWDGLVSLIEKAAARSC